MKLHDRHIRALHAAALVPSDRPGVWGSWRRGLEPDAAVRLLQDLGALTVELHRDRGRHRIQITAKGLAVLAANHPAVAGALAAAAGDPRCADRTIHS